MTFYNHPYRSKERSFKYNYSYCLNLIQQKATEDRSKDILSGFSEFWSIHEPHPNN
jgi:hypothetical protein